MQHKDVLTVLRDHIIGSAGQLVTPGQKAVEIERALERAGLAIVSTEVAAAFACIVSRGGCTAFQFSSLMVVFGLARIVPFDPEKHDAGGEEIAKRADFLEYSQVLKDALRLARPHIGGQLN